MDVCLVSMPQAPIQAPSPALGLLKAVLRRDGIEAKVLHAGFWFLEFVDPVDYVQIQAVRLADCIFDWLFAGAAFPGHRPDEDLYLNGMMRRSFNLGGRNPDEIRAQFLEIRKRIPEFVEEAARRVLSFSPRIVGCTSTFQQQVSSLALLRRIREMDPSIVTMMGGPNCETVMGRTTHENFPWVDYVVSGEADECISGLCRKILDVGRKVRPSDLPEGVFGPVHRQVGYPAGGTRDGLPSAVVPSLDDLPIPDYDDYFEQLQGSPLKDLILPAIPVESSRGCWWGQCRFCGLNGCARTFRAKPAARIAEEIETLVERYGSTRIALTDNVLSLDHFDSLLPRLACMGKELQIFCEIRTDLGRSRVEQLRAAGIRSVIAGVESLHSEALGLMNKGISAWQNVQALKWLRQYGIVAGWNFLFGFPGEQDRWYLETASWLPLLFHLSPCRFVYVKYCRYSSYFYNASEYGLKLIPQALQRFVYPLSSQGQKNMAFHFEEETTPDYYACLGEMRFPGRPGLEAVHRETLKWRMASSVPGGPILVMRPLDGGLEVKDSRPCAVAPVHLIPGPLRTVLERCDDAPPLPQLMADLEREDGLAEAEARRALSDLVDRKLVLLLDDRAISLVLQDPLPALLKTSGNPCGIFLPEEFQKDDLSVRSAEVLTSSPPA